jgi:hypothetical protein
MEFMLLSKEVTQDYCRKIRMPEGATRILLEITERINRDEKLYEIYKEFYVNYIDSGYWTTVWEPLNIHPYVEETFGNHASLFYLHAALERLPRTEQKYSEWGIGEDIFVETLRDIGVWVQNAYNLVGYYAIRNFSWIWRHLEAKLFRLGRMQYLAQPYKGDVKGFYNPQKDIVLFLCNTGLELRANGDKQGVCKKEKTTDGFVTEYQETDEYYVGNPVTPYGKGLKTQVKLKKEEWQKVLDQEDCLLDLHIPRDGEFDMKTITDSYLQAKEFFAKHFPELAVKGMVCHTWLFTPQLQEMLPQTSKIVKFQRQFYLYPTDGSVSFLWNFVFDELTQEKDAKPDNFLRSQVLNYLKDGKEIFDMNGVFLDVGGNLGDVSYMDQYDEGEYSFINHSYEIT